MSTPNDGGPAFPNAGFDEGMSLRAFLAGQALAGYRANGEFGRVQPQYIAEYCVADADALIAELAKEAK